MARLLVLAALLLGGSIAAAAQDWKATWDATLAAARTEGKVVVIGSPDPVMRNEVLPKFAARYPGINVEYVATGSSGQAARRVKTERAANLFTVDVFLSGADTSYNTLLKEKMIDPVKPLLILPEVTEAKYWKRGKPWFMDPEDQYVLRLYNTLQSSIFINADKVKPEEFTKAVDLLNPKWKGKIITDRPASASGSGGNQAANVYVQLGADFARRLYVDQAPVISNDRRQMTDWLARGTMYICLTCRLDDVTPLVKDGFNIKRIYELEGFKTRMVSSPFLLTYANKAPHPNAARVFINWMATKEATDVYAKGYGTVSERTDADVSNIDPNIIPKPGVDYPDDSSIQWRTIDKVAAGAKVKEILEAAGKN